MVTASKLLNRLRGVRKTGHGSWVALCPAHDDKHPSLSIREAEEGVTLLNPFCGCARESVLDAVGLTFSDLFPDRADHYHGPVRKRTDYRGMWLLCRRAVYVLAIAAEDLAAGRPISDKDLALVRAARRRLEQVQEVLGG